MIKKNEKLEFKTPFKIKESRVFNKLHQVEEIDYFMDMASLYFKQKYETDYLSIHVINNKLDFTIGRMDHDKWHYYLQSMGEAAHTNEGYAYPMFNIGVDEIIFTYFNSVKAWDRSINARAELIGTRKYGGCTVIVPNKNHDRIIYDITFKNDDSFGTLDKRTLNELIKDLLRYRDMLMPLLRHGELYGDFNNKKELNNTISSFKQQNPHFFVF